MAVVWQEYPVLAAAMSLQAVPYGIPDREKFPAESAATCWPQTVTAAQDPLVQNDPETEYVSAVHCA